MLASSLCSLLTDSLISTMSFCENSRDWVIAVMSFLMEVMSVINGSSLSSLLELDDTQDDAKTEIESKFVRELSSDRSSKKSNVSLSIYPSKATF